MTAVPFPANKIMLIRASFRSDIFFQSVYLPDNEKEISHRYNHLYGYLWFTLYNIFVSFNSLTYAQLIKTIRINKYIDLPVKAVYTIYFSF